MLKTQSTLFLLRSLCFAGAAAAIAACGANSGSALPPQGAGSASGPVPTATANSTTTMATTTSTSTTPTITQWKNGSAYAPSAVTVAFPSSPAAGHLLVVALWNNGQSTGAANTYTAPAGWSLVNQNTSHAYLTYQVFSHKVVAGEANSYVFKPLSAQREHVWIAADSNAASVDKSGNNYVSSTVFATPSLTPAQTNELALTLNLPDTNSSVTWTNPSGWSVGTGPTSTWRGEALTSGLSTSAISASSNLSGASMGFAGLVLLSPTQSVSAATPAPVGSPTAAPTNAPTAAPTANPIVSAGTASYHGCPLYAANDWFTTNLVSGGSSYVPNSVDPNSTNIVNNLTNAFGTVNFAADSPSNLEGVNIVNSSNIAATPQVQGLVYGFANDAYNDDPSPYHFEINSGTFMQEGTANCKQNGGDCHVTVLDTDKCVLYEAYKSGNYGNGTTGAWNGSTFWAEGGGVENLNHPYQIEHITVTAADLPMLGTTDFGEDLSYQSSACQPNCAIPHSVAFFLPKPAIATYGYVSPADGHEPNCTKGSGYCNSYTLPYGARLRLKSSYTCPSYSSYPQANLLCNQAKQYGWIFNDTVSVSGAGGIRLGLSSNATDPWNSGDYNQFLSNVHLTDFEVMTLGTVH